LEQNSIFNVIDPAFVERRELVLHEVSPILNWQNRPTGIAVEAFAVPGKIALFLEDQTKAEQGFGTEEGDTIGLKITSEDAASAVFYIPGCARIDHELKQRLDRTSCLLFDGTVYTDDEMLTSGVGSKTGQRMGHLHISGDDGSMQALADLKIGRRVYVHINNTNPILDDRSPEAAAVRQGGWEIGYDGMEIRL